MNKSITKTRQHTANANTSMDFIKKLFSIFHHHDCPYILPFYRDSYLIPVLTLIRHPINATKSNPGYKTGCTLYPDTVSKAQDPGSRIYILN